MIDKPQTKIDNFAVETCDYFTDVILDTCEIFSAGFEPLTNWNKKHKGLSGFLKFILFIAIVSGIVYYMLQPKTVTLTIKTGEGETTYTYETIRRRVDTFLLENGIEFDTAKDKIVDGHFYDGIKKNDYIILSKPYEVYLVVDQVKSTYLTHGTTVEELLAKAKIDVNPNDIVYPSEGEVTPYSEVLVCRILHSYIVEEEDIPYEIEYVEDDTITIGDVVITQEGQVGKLQKTYYIIYKNGEEISRTLVNERRVEEPITMIKHWGNKIDTRVPEGLSPVKVIENVKATSYFARGHASGSYGLYCSYGTVAVDPKVIPLGSLLYITGYGYAIANDTGTAVKGKWVDLYMEYRTQMFRYGSHKVTIYVLEYGDGTNAWNNPKKDKSIKLWVDGVLRDNPDVNYFEKYPVRPFM